jgi:hypothetical protein
LSEIQKKRSPKQQAVFARARQKATKQGIQTGRLAEQGRKTGAIFFAKKLGIFARTPEKITEDSQRGGKIAGTIAAESGRVSEMGHKGGILGGKVQGEINASNGHLHYARHRRWHVLAGKAPKKYCRFCPQKKPTT